MKNIKKSFLVVLLLSSAVYGYDWQQHVPDWTQFVPDHAIEDNVTSDEGIITAKNKHYGPTKIDQQILEDLAIFGPGTINNSTIKTTTQVLGPLKADSSNFDSVNVKGVLEGNRLKINNLTVRGPAVLKNSTVNGKTSVYGILRASDSTFREITAATTQLELDNSKADSIYIKSDGPTVKQYVVLKGKTEITGNIEFESGQGTLIIKNPDIKYGKLIGGKLKDK